MTDSDVKIGCTGKSAFTSYTTAARRAKIMRQEKDSAHVEPYHCRYCKRFHIGEARGYRPRSARKERP